MRLLQRHQLSPETVVLGVADLGPILGVVEVVVAVELPPQLLDPRRDIGRGCHGVPQDNNHPHRALPDGGAVSCARYGDGGGAGVGGGWRGAWLNESSSSGVTRRIWSVMRLASSAVPTARGVISRSSSVFSI